MTGDKLHQVVVYGLGAMGRPMARNLHQHGLLIGVKNRTQGKTQAIQKELGLTAFADDAALFAAADTVLTCVSADDDLKAIITGIIPLLKPGSVVIDCSTVAPQTAHSISDDLAAHGIAFLDAPVSGGVEGAKKGSLSIMVGGNRDQYKRAEDIFSAIGSQITHMGKVGQGQATKAVNQVMVAGVAQAVCSALAMAEQCKLDVKKVVEVLSAGAAGNWFLENRGQTMIKDEFNIGFKLDLLLKDLHICQSTLDSMNTSLPLVQNSIADYRQLSEAGYGDEDISALIRLKRCMLNHKELTSEKNNDA
ncbi:MAG: NAD(P)-dependent oxidoreductase [Proteobacteria bacterium]|nr:MAG: NAD(P)-dependent oxidoreductase [Pseudomonadota bacterium]